MKTRHSHRFKLPPEQGKREMVEERSLTTVAIRYEHDVVLARQRARQIAEFLGFDSHDQVRIATAVSEIARNVFRYANRGNAQFLVTNSTPAILRIRITDEGPGIHNLEEILHGKYVSQTGMGMGILGARRLMDEFEIETAPGKGTAILLGKSLPKRVGAVSDQGLAEVANRLIRQPPQDPFEELQRQNQELMITLAAVQHQKTELAQLNKELEDTNRGVVALYAELDERADYLRRASELKTQFLSNMSHEFRTPLNSILSLSRILLDGIDGPLTSEQQKQVHYIQKATQDLYELVNDLLDLAKVEAGKVAIRPAEFKVQDLFGALRGMLKPLLAHNSSVSLVFDDVSSLPNLVTDESKVSQILRNLISNALKFTENGEVRINATESGTGMIAFSVADTGIGIAAADQERIFEEFTQVEGPHQLGKTGTGLGLPLSRKLAQLLGGTLIVSSEPGRGSTFTLRIPAKFEGPAEVSSVPFISLEVDSNRIPVLVIEDNPETLFSYDKYLKNTPFQVLPARSLTEAENTLERVRPIAIILDILLGRENAWNFLSDLKQNAKTRDIPVFVVTQVENEHKARVLGADAFHAKPLERSWLLAKLSELVPQETMPTILLIDDDPASRYILSGLLSGTRFRMIESGSGQEGLELARKNKPMLIFLDLLMPGMDGFRFLDLLRQDPEIAGIPVAIHTSKELTPEDHDRLRGNIVAVIPKNHQDREASGRLIRKALEMAQPQSASKI